MFGVSGILTRLECDCDFNSGSETMSGQDLELEEKHELSNVEKRDLIRIQKFFGKQFDPHGVISESVVKCMRSHFVKLDDLIGGDPDLLKQSVQEWEINVNGRDKNLVILKLLKGIEQLNQQQSGM